MFTFVVCLGTRQDESPSTPHSFVFLLLLVCFLLLFWCFLPSFLFLTVSLSLRHQAFFYLLGHSFIALPFLVPLPLFPSFSSFFLPQFSVLCPCSSSSASSYTIEPLSHRQPNSLGTPSDAFRPSTSTSQRGSLVTGVS